MSEWISFAETVTLAGAVGSTAVLAAAVLVQPRGFWQWLLILLGVRPRTPDVRWAIGPVRPTSSPKKG